MPLLRVAFTPFLLAMLSGVLALNHGDHHIAKNARVAKTKQFLESASGFRDTDDPPNNSAFDHQTVQELADLFNQKKDSLEYHKVRPGVSIVELTHAFSGSQDLQPSALAASHSVEGLQSAAKIAHCLAGAARTLDSPLMYQNYVAHAIRPVEARHDLFFALEEGANADNKYDSAFRALQPRAVAYVKNGYQYDKWKACALMIEGAEVADQHEYDFVIKVRPDLVVLTDFPPVSSFPSQSVWLRPYFEQVKDVPHNFEDGTLTWYKWFLGEQDRDPTAGYGDLIIVMPRSIASEVLRVWDYREENFYTSSEVKQCGNRQECVVKVRMRTLDIPIEFRSFQVRILRQHGEEACNLEAADKKYNSMCI